MKRDNLLPRLWLIVFTSPWPQPFKIICLLSLSLCVDGMLELCSCSMFVNSAVCCLHSSPGEWSSVTETSISCHFLLSRITRTIGNNDTQHSHCYRIHTTFSTAPPPSLANKVLGLGWYHPKWSWSIWSSLYIKISCVSCWWRRQTHSHCFSFPIN